MGWFDFCPNLPALPVVARPEIPVHPQSCQNCHQTTPNRSSSHEVPGPLAHPIPFIRDAIAHGSAEQVRWWQDANLQTARLLQVERRHQSPFILDEGSLTADITPGAGGMGTLTSENHLIVHVQNRGMELLLNSRPLLEVTNLPIGGVEFFFDRGNLRTNRSFIPNWLVGPAAIQRQIGMEMIPVAYMQDSGTLLNAGQYRVLSDRNERENYLNNLSRPVDRRTRELQHRYYERNLRTIPYLSVLARNIASGHAPSTLDLQALYEDIILLSSLKSDQAQEQPTPPENLPSVRLNWDFRPARIQLPNFLAEFDQQGDANRLNLHLNLLHGELQTLQLDERVSFQRIFVPGILHLGRTSAHVQLNGIPLDLQVSNIQAELRPFDLMQSDPSQRGSLHVLGGRAQDGISRSIAGRNVPPGFSVRQENNHWVYSLNLHLEMQVEQEGGGAPIHLSTNLIAFGNLVQSERGLEPERGSTFFNLQDLQVGPEAAGATAVTPWLQALRFTASDRENLNGAQGFQIQLSGEQSLMPNYRGFNATSFLPLRPSESLVETVYALDDRSLAETIEAISERVSEAPVYRPDSHLSNFQMAVNATLRGAQGYIDTAANLEFQTQQSSSDPCSRSYRVALHGDQALFSSPLGNIHVAPVNLEVAASQRINPAGNTQVEVSRLSACINEGGRHPGTVRGPVCIRQEDYFDHPLRVEWNEHAGTMQSAGIENLNLHVGARHLAFPALAQASRQTDRIPEVSGLDVDARLRAPRLHYDFQTQMLDGLFCLVGDRSSDISFRDGRGRVFDTPLLSATQWCSLEPSRIDWTHQIIYGSFLLRTFVDLGQAQAFGYLLPMQNVGPYVLYSDNLPFSGSGFENFGRIFRQRLDQQGPGPLQVRIREQ